jgi:hypothetical protein
MTEIFKKPNILYISALPTFIYFIYYLDIDLGYLLDLAKSKKSIYIP